MPLEYENIPNHQEEDIKDFKIIYASRTHSQLKQVIKELKNTKYKPKVAILGSREHLCVHDKIGTMHGTQQIQACRDAVKKRK